jgi:hypothetical protein
MAPTTTLILRFLLPRQGAVWRRASSVRHYAVTKPGPSKANKNVPSAAASKSSGSKPTKGAKPLVLEKPSHFRPPSHGARRIKEAPRYPGPILSEEEEAARRMKKYPNMMPAEGTFMHWFLNNRSIHLWITLVRLSFHFNWTTPSRPVERMDGISSY